MQGRAIPAGLSEAEVAELADAILAVMAWASQMGAWRSTAALPPRASA
jgi:hypothetical protein